VWWFEQEQLPAGPGIYNRSHEVAAVEDLEKKVPYKQRTFQAMKKGECLRVMGRDL
jgi:hypothetical protein